MSVLDAPAKTRIRKQFYPSYLPEQVPATELAGEPIECKLTKAPGNGAALGGCG